MEKDKSIHKTSTGKLFQLIDLEGNPIDYVKCNGHFGKCDYHYLIYWSVRMVANYVISIHTIVKVGFFSI